jgi:anti-sigma regulatory factor (Ser/Thr protein kinase)
MILQLWSFIGKVLGKRNVQVKTIELHLTSNPEMLRVLRAAIQQMCCLAGFAKVDCSKITLAVDEACTNVIKHAYKNHTGLPIVVTCKIGATHLEITVQDYGEPADIHNIKPRPLDEIRPGGLGVYIIRSVMDEVSYSNLPDIGNRLVMSKFLPREKKA